MTNSKKTTPADNETVLACKLAMTETTLAEVESLLSAAKEIALAALDGDDDGNLCTAVADLVGQAGYCIANLREDAGMGPGMLNISTWIRSPAYCCERNKYRKAVAQLGGVQ